MLSHLAKQKPENIQTWVYHGHNLIRELEIFCDAEIDMRLPTVQTIFEWLRRYYIPNEGVFGAQASPIPDYIRHVSTIFKDFEAERGTAYWPDIAKVGLPVLRYNLFRLVEDDWLTYRLTKLAIKMSESPLE